MSETVLIVDGDVSFAESAQGALEAQGLTVFVEDDAPNHLLKRLKPNVLLLNVELPRSESAGFAICSRVRKDPDLKTLPIVLMSGQSMAAAFDQHAKRPDCADDYLLKPLDLAEVVERVGRFVALPGPGETIADPDMEEEFESFTDPEATVAGPIPDNEATGETQSGSDDNTSSDDSDSGPPQRATSRSQAPPLPITATPPPSGPPSPPPLRRREPAPDRIQDVDELWPRAELEAELRSRLDASEPTPPSKRKPTPEERVAFLRQLVNHYKTKVVAVDEAWATMHERGIGLARRVVVLSTDLKTREDRLEEIIRDREGTRQRLNERETELRDFRDKITAIFQEKDQEEQERLQYLQGIESENARLGAELKEAQERHSDDETRLRILQDELDQVQTKYEELEHRLHSASQSIQSNDDKLRDTVARLDMTQAVATERAEEIDDLRSQLDSLAISAEKEQRQSTEAHRAELERVSDELNQTIDSLRSELEHMTVSLANVEADRESETEAANRLAGSLQSEKATLERDLPVQIEPPVTARDAAHRPLREAHRLRWQTGRGRGAHRRPRNPAGHLAKQ